MADIGNHPYGKFLEVWFAENVGCSLLNLVKHVKKNINPTQTFLKNKTGVNICKYIL